MKKIAIVLGLMACLCMNGMAEDSGIRFFDDEVDFNVLTVEPSWIISNELIERLNLKPFDEGYTSLLIAGEDGECYSWVEIITAHMDWIESNTK